MPLNLNGPVGPMDDSGEELMAEINVVPLTDVMLVLLVIFMVATPLLVVESFKVRLSESASTEASTGAQDTPQAETTIVTVTEEGIIFIDGSPVRRVDFLAELTGVLKGRPEALVLLKGDPGARHGLVVEVLELSKKAGAKKLSISSSGADSGSGSASIDGKKRQ